MLSAAGKKFDTFTSLVFPNFYKNGKGRSTTFPFHQFITLFAHRTSIIPRCTCCVCSGWNCSNPSVAGRPDGPSILLQHHRPGIKCPAARADSPRSDFSRVRNRSPARFHASFGLYEPHARQDTKFIIPGTEKKFKYFF